MAISDPKPQDLLVHTDGSVTKDQSGWGFTVRQGVTTIPDDGAAYMVNLQLDDGSGSSCMRWIALRGDRPHMP